MKNIVRPALVLLVLLSAMTGIAYPMLVTAAARVFFPDQAVGRSVTSNGKAVGAELIGQQFSNPKYFWGRLSATSPMPYNGLASGGSNLAPTNPALVDAVKGRIDALKAAQEAAGLAFVTPVPADLVTASASGLDPHISPQAARYQARRVAQARGLTPETVVSLIESLTEQRQFGLLGEPRVNVLALNLALDAKNSAVPVAAP